MPRIKPGDVWWETSMPPLCYPTPQESFVLYKLVKLLYLSDNQSLLFILTCPWQETGWNAATFWSFCRVVRDIDLLTWDVSMGEVFQHPEWRHLLKNSFTLFRRRIKNFSKQIFRSETISETFEAVACQKKLKTKKVKKNVFLAFSTF